MLTIFTLVLNGMPRIAQHLETFRQLQISWRWRIVEGVASPLNCTSWCRQVPPEFQRDGLSVDGTTEYLDGINDYRVEVIRANRPWDGKIAMIAAALEGVEDGAVMEIDADEIWTATQLETMHQQLMPRRPGDAMQFACRVFVGPRKVVTTKVGFGSMPYEWFRAWRWGPGLAFVRHEPPKLNRTGAICLRKSTVSAGLVFDHYAYETEAQVRFKEAFYGYAGLTESWRRLQQTPGEVQLCRFFPWLRDEPWVKADDLA
jgi:hypothetical protein